MVAILAVDISLRKLAEEALRESEERYRVLFEGSTHGILAVDIETGRLTSPGLQHLQQMHQAVVLLLSQVQTLQAQVSK